MTVPAKHPLDLISLARRTLGWVDNDKTHASASFSSHQGEAGAPVYKPTAGGSGSVLFSRLSRSASNARAPSLAGIPPPGSSDAEQPPSPAGRSIIELTSSDEAPPPKPRVQNNAKSWTFPDGEVVTIESSDEDNAGDVTFSQNIVMATPQPRMIFESALLLFDPKNLTPMGREGGILTPSTAFGDRLAKALEDTGKFETSSEVLSVGNAELKKTR
ncbi:hypothetical protein FRC07_010061 [Ceratobasidium sp. 392]|nr:hypothetical protein FRC07_010061 [Ceratobasidium sp. 392]